MARKVIIITDPGQDQAVAVLMALAHRDRLDPFVGAQGCGQGNQSAATVSGRGAATSRSSLR